ncbi:MAG TPA: CsgG/HfaB family protein, partial [Beijerinckiaceae bacterium]|nr:CsgG/HfaB family protein [Beijerinckiaceae bacterium]
MVRPVLGVVLAAALLAGCAAPRHTGTLGIPPRIGTLTPVGDLLAALPPPARPINVAVYEFPDLTGQNRPNPLYADYSRAVTQGGAAILVDALKTAGRGAWFRVVERGNLDSLLRERQLIQETYEVLRRDRSEKIDPLEFADYLITGGIVSFDAAIDGSKVG